MGQGSNSHLGVWGRRDSQQLCMMEAWANWKVMGRLTKKNKTSDSKEAGRRSRYKWWRLTHMHRHAQSERPPGTPEWPPPRSVSSPPLHRQRSLQIRWWQRDRELVTDRRRKRQQERKKKLKNNNITSKLENTHYFCVASVPPLGTRSGNGRNKRNREKRLQYLGQKALRALEKEFRI